MGLSKKVNIKELINPDIIEIDKDDSFPMAYAFELPLDATPDDVWQSIFEAERKSSFYMMKKKSHNRRRQIESDNSSRGNWEKIEWVTSLVSSTNKRVEEYNEEIRRREEEKKTERKLHEETIRKMRERLRKK